MAACSTRAEFDRALQRPVDNQKAIRSTLGDRRHERWALLALEDALKMSDPATFSVLKVIARPCVSKKRVAEVRGSAGAEPWSRFFSKSPADPPAASAGPAARTQPVRRRPKAAVKKVATQGIPLRDAGALVRSGMARQTAKKAAGGRKSAKAKKQAVDSYLEGVVQCRECLRSYKRIQLPNPRRRVCENCGGQPESTSVRTVSGGSPGLGRRR